MAGMCGICNNFQMYNLDSRGEITIVCIACKYSGKIKEQKKIFSINYKEIEIKDKEITLLRAKQNIYPYYEDYCNNCKKKYQKRKRLISHEKNMINILITQIRSIMNSMKIVVHI